MNRKRKSSDQPGGSPSPWNDNLFANPDLRVLRFQSEADLDAAIDLLWTDALRSLPHATPDGRALVVPVEAVPYFARAGIKFRSTKLLSMSDLTPEEIRVLRSGPVAPNRS